MLDFPSALRVGKKVEFKDGKIIKLPTIYCNGKLQKELTAFYLEILSKEYETVVVNIDPAGLNYVAYRNFVYVGLLIAGSKSNSMGKFRKIYPLNIFSYEYIVKRICAEKQLYSYEEFIPIKSVVQSFHEIRNLNSKISSNIDELIGANIESEWEQHFDNANENVKKIYVASRLLKFILDNISFLTPTYFENLKLNEGRSFVIHRSVSKIVKIFKEDFKKKKGLIEFRGQSYCKLVGDKELFEVILMLLLENAIKYSSDVSSIAPKVQIEETVNTVCITIASFGLIVPESEKEQLFLRGFRSTVNKNNTNGTGMGLYNAQKIANLFGAEIKYHGVPIEAGQIGWNRFTITCKRENIT